MGMLKTGELEGIAQPDEKVFGSVSQGSQTSPERARYESYVLKFQKQFGISRDQAIQLIEKYGGIDKVIADFQMQSPESIQQNTGTLIDLLKGTKQNYGEIAAAANAAE